MTLGGQEVERSSEGTATVPAAFRATIEQGAEPLVPVRPAVAVDRRGVIRRR
jgi:hypothetical protein